MKTQIIRNMLIGLSLTFAFGSCHIYKSYERPEGVSASDSLYRQPAANGDTTTSTSILRTKGAYSCAIFTAFATLPAAPM